MKKRNQPDLFGDDHLQGDLFGAPKAAPRQSAINLDLVRKRLGGIIADMRAAEEMFWDEPQQLLFLKIVPDMAGLLPGDEGEPYVAAFKQEWHRLMTCPIQYPRPRST